MRQKNNTSLQREAQLEHGKTGIKTSLNLKKRHHSISGRLGKERWIKASKFYTAPSTVPFPKKEKSIKKSSKDYSNEMYARHILKIVRLKTDRQIDSMWK